MKNTPVPLSVQRKSAEEAEATYQEILKAMSSESPQLLQLSCDHQADKKIGVLSNQIGAVMVSQKSGAAGAGRTPGFSLAE